MMPRWQDAGRATRGARVAIPLIDLNEPGPSAGRGPLPACIDQALVQHGFMAVQGHGVAPAVLAAAFAASQRFFALPEATKRRWHIEHSPLSRGFDPIGWQALDPAAPPDLKESYYLGAEALGPNPWPDEAVAPGFRAALEACATAQTALARRLMALMAQALGLPAGFFEPFMRVQGGTTRLLHYPPQPAQPAPGQVGCGAHTDWGALTLLAQDDAGGLQVQATDGRWLEVPPMPGAFVVNIGDLMARWTNGRWRSTPHRVINRAGRERYSIAFFLDMDADAVIEPLPGCVSEDRPARQGPITAGEHLAEMRRRTTVGAGAA
jgi:isopenicillin N synthase-like dioxygenase